MPKVQRVLLLALVACGFEPPEIDCAQTMQITYADADGDHFGDDDTAEKTCGVPIGRTTQGGDCDDSYNVTFPNTSEACDGQDNDCDGEIDEGLEMKSYWVDADGDGYGDAANEVQACMQTDGQVTNDTDCDDADPNNYPGNTEACDGADNDCDGWVDCGNGIDAECPTYDCGGWVEDFENGLGTEWVLQGNPVWFAQDRQFHEGAYAAECGNIGDNQNTSMEFSAIFSGEGTIRFWHKGDTESGWDFLRFYIDGGKESEWSGGWNWTEHVYNVSAGEHSFRWEYHKDQSVSSGADTVWVDLIEITEGVPL